MHLYGDFDEILENNLIIELEWLKNEFDLFFGQKEDKINEKDKKLAHKIIEKFVDNITIIDNKKILELIAETLNYLELKYPNLLSN